MSRYYAGQGPDASLSGETAHDALPRLGEDDVEVEGGGSGSAGHSRNVSAAAGSAGVFTEDRRARVLKGRGAVGVDPRKYKYDVVRGMGKLLPFMTTREDRMSADEAGRTLHEIHVMFGVDKELEHVIASFDSGMFFCHTVNGSSTLTPGRSTFVVMMGDGSGEPETETFDFGKIVAKLGVAQRRFFRAFADDIVEVNKRVLRDYDPYDPVSAEHRGWLIEVAHKRAISRYPHLAADSADSCLDLSIPERQAVLSSKSFTIGNTPNSVDRMRPDGHTESADRFDSSVGVSY